MTPLEWLFVAAGIIGWLNYFAARRAGKNLERKFVRAQKKLIGDFWELADQANYLRRMAWLTALAALATIVWLVCFSGKFKD